jgi:hypothetical protein
MPTLSPQDQFQRALGVASAEFKKKKISVRFSPIGKMRFMIDEASLKDSLALAGMEEGKFRETFDNEIGPLLEAVVSDNVEQYLDATRFRQSEEMDAKAWPERRATLSERSKLVREAITDPELRGRHLIKTTSKHPRLRNYLWEVARKLSLSSETDASQPYVTLSLETIRPEHFTGLLAWLPFFPSDSVGRSEFCTFDCDEVDLDDLIKVLQDAKTALGKTASGGISHGR